MPVETRIRLNTHLEFVHARSPYYREHWQSCWGRSTPSLQALPPTDHLTYWRANTVEDNRVLTGAQEGGVVFKSGGTTGAPKFSFYSNEDWRNFCRVFGNGMRRGGLQAGERVGNIFYGGQLYASLLFIGRCIEEAGVGVNYPLSGSAPTEDILAALQLFSIDTLAGLPSTLMNLLPGLGACKPERLVLRRFIYGGEAMFPDQIAALHRVLPECRVQSIGIAGVDFGEMGWCEESSEPGVHRVFDESTVLEILDEQWQPIEAPGVPGELHITNVLRRLMPVIRYPVGDRGEWIDPPGTPARRFRVLGRTDKGARIGPVTLYVEDVQRVLARSAAGVDVLNFQLLIEHFDRRDACTLRVAVADPAGVAPEWEAALLEALYVERPMFREEAEKGFIHPLRVEWVSVEGMHSNPRTGKTPRVLDRRHAT